MGATLKTLLTFLTCYILCFTAAASDLSKPEEFKLENGLKIIIKEDHRSPLVVIQVWYKVGSSYEPNGITGISHALEHMMFRGTHLHPKDEFTRFIAISGGDQNAFTSNDVTAYYEEIDPSRLKLCFELEADRMRNLALTDEAFDQEIKVVMEERRLRTDDNPEGLAIERLFAAAHMSNPYHHPTVGWMNDLENLTVTDLRNWYNSWYGPNNATLVVVGDVNPKEVLALAKTYFGPLKPINIPTLKPRKEAAHIGKKHIQVMANTNVLRLMMTYNVPSIRTAQDPREAYALLVLLKALDGGNSSRFSKELIRGKSIAADIFSWYSPFQLHEGVMLFGALPTEKHTLKELEDAFLQQVTKLQTAPISEQELNRIKANTIAEHVFARDSTSEQAQDLGFLESIGLSWEEADNFPDKIQSITAGEVQKVAQKYLLPERLTVAELIPLKTGK